jgi:hypothetical protein
MAVNMEGRMSSRHFSLNIWRDSHFDGVLEPVFLLKYVFLMPYVRFQKPRLRDSIKFLKMA